MIKIQNLRLPTGEEIKIALKLAQADPEDPFICFN